MIEATEPVPYVASRPDALTLLLELRNVASEGVANKVVRTSGPIAGVALETTGSWVPGLSGARHAQPGRRST